MNIETKICATLILVFTLIPSSYFSLKMYKNFDELQEISVNSAVVFKASADLIDSGGYVYTPSDLSARFRSISEGDKKVVRGYQSFKKAVLVWLGLAIFCALANAYFLRRIYVNFKKSA